MKTLYFDCFSGISGDMTIGALIDLGVDFDYLETEIGKLPIEGFRLESSRVIRANLSATKFDVVIGGGLGRAGEGDEAGHPHEHATDHSHPHDERSHSHVGHDGHEHVHHSHHAHGPAHVHRKAAGILDMIRASALAAPVRTRAVAIFEKLAVSEGRVHGMPPEDVEFHEVGAIDSIVDVVGAAIGLDAIGVEQFICSPINVGGGFIHCQHGIYPVPPPATSNLLAGAPVYSRHVETELVTPTGAAILAATVDRFEPMDHVIIDKVGYGAGTKDLGAFPNCLRMFLGTQDAMARAGDRGVGSVMVIEANIDDMSAEALAWASEKLLDSGALDVLMVPVQMKKGRPGHLLQIIVRPEDEPFLTRIVFEETTTIGVRSHRMARRVLDRVVLSVDSRLGPIRVKVASENGRVLNVSPEYEDCARIARDTGEPFHQVREEALRSYREQSTGGRVINDG